MIRLLADENFNAHVTRGVLRRIPQADLITPQQAGLAGMDDAALLEWAGAHGRILLTHDVNTLIGLVYKRIAAGAAMPGVLIAPASLTIAQTIDALLFVLEAGEAEDFVDQVRYLPI
jgi:hypothetical protein